MRRELLLQTQTRYTVTQLSNHASMQQRLYHKKNLDWNGVHTAQVKFSTVPAKNLTSILTWKFLNG